MTLGEFKAWLDGYLSAGGKDLTVIKSKLDETQEAPAYFSPISPTYDPLRPDTGRMPNFIPTFTICGEEGKNRTVAVS